MSSSGDDFGTDGTEDEYVPERGYLRNPQSSLRGIMAFQSARRQKGAFVHTQQSITSSSALIGVSSRGQVRGRRRARVSGSDRVSTRGRGYSFNSDRNEMLDEHRRIVQDLCEDDMGMSDVAVIQRVSTLPMLNEGSFINGI